MDLGSLSAVVFGIIGSACMAIFIIGGKADNDGQGTNMTWSLGLTKPIQKGQVFDSAFFCVLPLNTAQPFNKKLK